MKERIAYILDRFTPLCWADLVSWFMRSRTFIEVIKSRDHRGCVQESTDVGSCYCGKYQNGKMVSRKKSKSQRHTVVETNLDLPF